MWSIELFRNIIELKILGGWFLPHLCANRAGHASLSAHPCPHSKTITNTSTARKGKSTCWEPKLYNFTSTEVSQQWGFEMGERIRKELFQNETWQHTWHIPIPLRARSAGSSDLITMLLFMLKISNEYIVNTEKLYTAWPVNGNRRRYKSIVRRNRDTN